MMTQDEIIAALNRYTAMLPKDERRGFAHFVSSLAHSLPNDKLTLRIRQWYYGRGYGGRGSEGV